MNGRPWIDKPASRRVNHAPHCNLCGDPVNSGHRMNKVGLVCPKCDREHRLDHFSEAPQGPHYAAASLRKVNR